VLVGPELLEQTTEKVRTVRNRIQASQSRQKAYVDRKRRPLEFTVGDHVFLRVTQTTGLGRALRSRKLSPKFLGPYQITRRIGPVAYEIALPPQLANLHPVFHVSQLRSTCLTQRMCWKPRIYKSGKTSQWKYHLSL